jgi:predicted negative regulator of RcsB-dependent stress response
MADDPQQHSAPLAEISHGPSAFEIFLDRHHKSLIILLILLILGVAGFVIYQGIEEGTRVTAGNSLYRAVDADSLQKVISEYPKTPAGATARILLAEKQWSDGQQEAAVETLKSFLAESPGHPGIPSAKAALAAKLMAQGKAAEAASAFEELVDDPASAYLAPYALLSLGDMALAGGDKDKAKSFYERAQSDFSSSGFGQKITQRIAALHATIPVEIDPPPAPPEPKPATPSFPVPFAPNSSPLEITIPPVEPADAPANPAETKSSDTSDDQS